jgi:hypothetical protein
MHKAVKHIALVVVGALLTNVAFAQGIRYRFAGLDYFFPAAHGTGPLTNDGTGTLSWAGQAFPSGLAAFSTTGVCPAGWTEHTAARGRYVVAAISGGTVGGTVGTVLTNLQNREVGLHTHTATLGATIFDPGHSHGITDPGHAHGDMATGSGGVDSFPASMMIGDFLQNTSSSTTGITINNATPTLTPSYSTTIVQAGSITGTNAPYIQHPLCVKT